MDRKINGIETDIVIHIFPEKCPSCLISSDDPVIISRAKAMLVVATYRRSNHSICKYSSIHTLDSLTTRSINSLQKCQWTGTSEEIYKK